MPFTTVDEGERPHLLTDKEIAKTLNVSTSWVRKERHLRHAGQTHSLTIDPIYVGSSPRYRSDEFSAWLENLRN